MENLFTWVSLHGGHITDTTWVPGGHITFLRRKSLELFTHDLCIFKKKTWLGKPDANFKISNLSIPSNRFNFLRQQKYLWVCIKYRKPATSYQKDSPTRSGQSILTRTNWKFTWCGMKTICSLLFVTNIWYSSILCIWIKGFCCGISCSLATDIPIQQ